MELIWCSPGQGVPCARQERFRVRQDVGKPNVCDLGRALRAEQHVACSQSEHKSHLRCGLDVGSCWACKLQSAHRS